MRLQQLYLMLLLERYGTLSAVAKETNMAQSTISYNLKSLEEELGVKLFHKNGNYLSFTVLGKQVLQHIENIEIAKENMQNVAKQQTVKGQLTGKLDIGYGNRFCGAILVQAFIYLKEHFHNITASMYMYDNQAILEWIAQRKLNGGLIETNCIDEMESFSLIAKNDLVYDKLFSEEMCFVAKTSHPIFQKTNPVLFDVMQYPFITSRKSASDLYVKFLRKNGNENKILFVPDYKGQHNLIETFDYITFMSYSAFLENTNLYKYDLRIIKLQDFTCDCNFYWVHSMKLLSTENRNMLEELKKAIDQAVERNDFYANDTN